jgi:hypothetical protein
VQSRSTGKEYGRGGSRRGRTGSETGYIGCMRNEETKIKRRRSEVHRRAFGIDMGESLCTKKCNDFTVINDG